ncbi:MAG: DNA-binding response regulator [Methylocystis sp.]|nr:MAG: DNA-binding response regulator [Methylocystis sp.]
MSSKSVVFYIGQDQNIASAARLADEFEIRSFSTLAEFLANVDHNRRGCVIVDLQPGLGMETSLRLFCHELLLPTIVLADSAVVPLAVRAMKEGAADFLQKPVTDERLLSAVRGALSIGETKFERARRTRAIHVRFVTLTAREREVVDAVLNGCSNREIGARLGISARTVETHRSKAMAKLGARTPADLVRVWMDMESMTGARAAAR